MEKKRIKASVSIFKNSLEYEDVTQPYIPSDVFEAANRVMEHFGCEVVKTRNGFYVVKYSETGPFPSQLGNKEWLPVYVARLHQWTSGGIKRSEMDNFNQLSDQTFSKKCKE